MRLRLRHRVIDLGERTALMGILNVTPDSFSDGGHYFDSERAVGHALSMLEAGADMLDIGGESTRPGSLPVSVSEEIGRVIPVITGILAQQPECIISIDTTKPDVAREALKAGALIVNDISGLQATPELAEIAAEYEAGLVLMHMRGTPATMQAPEHLVYRDLIRDVLGFLENAVETAVSLGVERDGIVIDPGVGFSKNLHQNLTLLRNIDEFFQLGCPVLVGPSRKSFIGKVLNQDDPLQRIWGTSGVIAWLCSKEAVIARVHDVKEMNQVIELFEACADPGRYADSCD